MKKTGFLLVGMGISGSSEFVFPLSCFGCANGQQSENRTNGMFQFTASELGFFPNMCHQWHSLVLKKGFTFLETPRIFQPAAKCGSR